MPVAHLKGTTIHYREAGSSDRAVLLLHAFPLNSGMWQGVLDALGPRYRLVAPDYRGMGRSGQAPAASTMDLLAEDAAALLRHLGIERAAVAGVSLGGYVALELYRRHPQLFRGLALCNTKASADDEAAKANREKFAVTVLEKGAGYAADDFIPKLLKPSPDPAVAAKVRAIIMENSPAGIAAAQRGMARRPDSTATLAQLECPALVVCGEHDAISPPPASQTMAGSIPGGRFKIIPGTGHLSLLEAPGAFHAVLGDFLDSLPA